MMFQEPTFNQTGLASSAPWVAQPYCGLARYWEVGEYAELMQQLLSFLDTVFETAQVPFSIRDDKGYRLAVRNPVGASNYRSLAGFLPLCGQWMDLYWPGYAYSADMQLFFDCFMQHPFSRVFGFDNSMMAVDQTTAASLYNDFIAVLRMEAVRLGVRKSLIDWRANLSEQGMAIRRYLGELAATYRNLIPIRLDLEYAECAFDGSEALQRMRWEVSADGTWLSMPSRMPVVYGQAEIRARIDTAAAMNDRDNFFDNRRGVDKALFEHMVGYVCKLEQGGRSCANHFHCIFYLDGNLLTQSDACWIKYGLVDRWRRVTNDRGQAFDCHERPDRASLVAQGKWAIDPLDCGNAMQIARHIEYVVNYFAKDDGQMIRVKPTARARTLTMGR